MNPFTLTDLRDRLPPGYRLGRSGNSWCLWYGGELVARRRTAARMVALLRRLLVTPPMTSAGS